MTPSALAPGGPQAGTIADLWWIFFAICATAFVLTLAALAYALWHRRDADDGRDDAQVERHASSRALLLVASATSVVVVLLFVMLVSSVVAGQRLTQLTGKNAVNIQVTARQWWWDVQYTHPTPSLRITSPNEIHIPVGEPVHIELRSTDVIHSFWVPNLHGKRDVIPAHASDQWLQADRPGVYRGQCAEFCGHQHAKMAFFVVAEPRPDFEQWVARQQQAAPEPTGEEQRRGRELVETSDCALCHRVMGTRAGATVGPDLTHVASRIAIAGASVPNGRDTLRRFIEDPAHFKPGVRMPRHTMSDDDLQAVAAYLGSLR